MASETLAALPAPSGDVSVTAEASKLQAMENDLLPGADVAASSSEMNAAAEESAASPKDGARADTPSQNAGAKPRPAPPPLMIPGPGMFTVPTGSTPLYLSPGAGLFYSPRNGSSSSPMIPLPSNLFLPSLPTPTLARAAASVSTGFTPLAASAAAVAAALDRARANASGLTPLSASMSDAAAAAVSAGAAATARGSAAIKSESGRASKSSSSNKNGGGKGGGGGDGGGDKGSNRLTLDQLSAYFHLPINEVAKELGICATVLKKVCRKNKIPRWPHRKVKSLDQRIQRLQTQAASASGAEANRLASQIRMLQDKRAQLLKNPAADLKLLPARSGAAGSATSSSSKENTGMNALYEAANAVTKAVTPSAGGCSNMVVDEKDSSPGSDATTVLDELNGVLEPNTGVANVPLTAPSPSHHPHSLRPLSVGVSTAGTPTFASAPSPGALYGLPMSSGSAPSSAMSLSTVASSSGELTPIAADLVSTPSGSLPFMPFPYPPWSPAFQRVPLGSARSSGGSGRSSATAAGGSGSDVSGPTDMASLFAMYPPLYPPFAMTPTGSMPAPAATPGAMAAAAAAAAGLLPPTPHAGKEPITPAAGAAVSGDSVTTES